MNNGGGGPTFLDGGGSAAGGHSPRPRDNKSTEDGGRSELGGLSPRSPMARSQGLPGVGGGGSGGGGVGGGGVGGGGGGGLGSQPGVRPREVQLTAVTFAANAPVMAVGKKPKESVVAEGRKSCFTVCPIHVVVTKTNRLQQGGSGGTIMKTFPL